MQMLSTTVLGFAQMYVPCGLYQKVERRGKPSGFVKNMIIVGCMRLVVVLPAQRLLVLFVTFQILNGCSGPFGAQVHFGIIYGDGQELRAVVHSGIRAISIG